MTKWLARPHDSCPACWCAMPNGKLGQVDPGFHARQIRRPCERKQLHRKAGSLNRVLGGCCSPAKVLEGTTGHQALPSAAVQCAGGVAPGPSSPTAKMWGGPRELPRRAPSPAPSAPNPDTPHPYGPCPCARRAARLRVEARPEVAILLRKPRRAGDRAHS